MHFHILLRPGHFRLYCWSFRTCAHVGRGQCRCPNIRDSHSIRQGFCQFHHNEVSYGYQLPDPFYGILLTGWVWLNIKSANLFFISIPVSNKHEVCKWLGRVNLQISCLWKVSHKSQTDELNYDNLVKIKCVWIGNLVRFSRLLVCFNVSRTDICIHIVYGRKHTADSLVLPEMFPDIFWVFSRFFTQDL